MSAGRKTSGTVAWFLSPAFNFVTVFKGNYVCARIWNVPFHVFHNTHLQAFTVLYYNRSVGNLEESSLCSTVEFRWLNVPSVSARTLRITQPVSNTVASHGEVL
jgi:hypothetical protein